MKTIDIEEVEKIMGRNFWGVKDWLSYCNVVFTKEQISEIMESSFDTDILNAPCPFEMGKSIKETHFAFLGLDEIRHKPLTIIEFQELISMRNRSSLFPKKRWYKTESFANNKTCALRLYLMPLAIIPKSTEKIFQEQLAILPEDYEVPSAIEEVFKDILYYKKNGILLNPSKWAMCQDITSWGERDRVAVGAFNINDEGLSINHFFDGKRNFFIGPATSLKLSM